MATARPSGGTNDGSRVVTVTREPGNRARYTFQVVLPRVAWLRYETEGPR